jgi:hypothetical protein
MAPSIRAETAWGAVADARGGADPFVLMADKHAIGRVDHDPDMS